MLELIRLKSEVQVGPHKGVVLGFQGTPAETSGVRLIYQVGFWTADKWNEQWFDAFQVTPVSEERLQIGFQGVKSGAHPLERSAPMPPARDADGKELKVGQKIIIEATIAAIGNDGNLAAITEQPKIPGTSEKSELNVFANQVKAA